MADNDIATKGIMMKLTKSFTAFTALATTAALALLPSLPSQAAPLEDPATTSARSFLATFGADEAVQDRTVPPGQHNREQYEHKYRERKDASRLGRVSWMVRRTSERK